MNWYNRLHHNKFIGDLTFEEILSRINSAKERLKTIKSQEEWFINRLNEEEANEEKDEFKIRLCVFLYYLASLCTFFI